MDKRTEFIASATIENYEDIVYKAIHYYNGFLDFGHKIKVEEDMALDTTTGVDEMHFSAILILIQNYLLGKFNIELDIDQYSEDAHKQNTINKMAKFIMNKVDLYIEKDESDGL